MTDSTQQARAASTTHPAQEAAAWTRAMRRREADEAIRERPYEERHWLRYFGTYRSGRSDGV